MPLGLPHSVFLGRVVGPGDPAWLPDDQDKALAWRHEQALLCQRCKTRADEWDPKQGGDRNAYVADVNRCGGCEVIDQAQRDLADMDDTHGIHVGLTPRPEDDEA